MRPDDRDGRGRLRWGGRFLSDLADRFGTPLGVIDLDRFGARARELVAAFGSAAGPATGALPVRSNDVAGVLLRAVREGLALEVASELELEMTLRLGVDPARLLVSGVGKPRAFLERVVGLGPVPVVLGSADEAVALEAVAREASSVEPIPVFLAVRSPVSRREDPRAITGLRDGGAFGVEARGPELGRALECIHRSPHLDFRGPSVRLGTGLRDHRVLERRIRRLRAVVGRARAAGLRTRAIHLSGSFGTDRMREMTTLELLRYQGTFRVPPLPGPGSASSLADHAAALTRAVDGLDGIRPVVDASTWAAGPSQVLLVRVSHRKHRPGMPPWVITDGGTGTVAFPLYYEIHEVVNASRAPAGRACPVTIVGPVCFSTDWIYRNLPQGPIEPGDVLVVRDTGAYVTALECNFGFGRSPVVGLAGGEPRLLRARETTDDVLRRDVLP